MKKCIYVSHKSTGRKDLSLPSFLCCEEPVNMLSVLWQNFFKSLLQPEIYEQKNHIITQWEISPELYTSAFAVLAYSDLER